MWVAVPPSMLNRIDVRRATHHATFAILAKCACRVQHVRHIAFRMLARVQFRIFTEPRGAQFSADSSGCRWPSYHAVTLKLPCVMADPVKPKRLYRCLDGPDFVLDLVGLNRLVAQRAWPAGSETAPKPRRRLAGYLSLCDAFTCEGPQFFFESPEQQVGRAHGIPPVE
jgi:hypothetical protein